MNSSTSTPASYSLSLSTYALTIIAAIGVVLVVWMFVSPELSLFVFPVIIFTSVAGFIVLIRTLALGRDIAITMLFSLLVVAIDFTLQETFTTGASKINTEIAVKAFLYGTVFLLGLIHGVKRGLTLPVFPVLLVYSIIALASVSYTPLVHLAISSGLALLGIFLSAAVLSDWTPDRIHRLWTWLFVALFILALGSIIEFAIWRESAIAHGIAGTGRLRGLTGHPNSLGPLMGIGIIVGIFLWRTGLTRSWKWTLVIGMAIMCIDLVLTDSRTAQLSLISGLILLAVVHRPFWTWFFLVMLTILAWVLLSGIIDTLLAWTAVGYARSGGAHEVYTFTGRTDIWAFCWEKWQEAPWFGFGIGSPRVVIPAGWANFWGQSVGTAHNLLLESLLSLGLIGTGLLLIAAGWLAIGLGKLIVERRYLDHPDRLLVQFASVMLLFIFMDGLMEKSFSGTVHPNVLMLAIVMGIYASVNKRYLQAVVAKKNTDVDRGRIAS